MFRILAIRGTAIALAAFASLPAAAQDSPSQTDAFANAATLGDADLQTVAGREDLATMVATANQRNTVSNNSVVGNSTTGGVQIDGNAFQNLQGLAVISANSGNNVAINSAMNVTINLAPMPR